MIRFSLRMCVLIWFVIRILLLRKLCCVSSLIFSRFWCVSLRLCCCLIRLFLIMCGCSFFIFG